MIASFHFDEIKEWKTNIFYLRRISERYIKYNTGHGSQYSYTWYNTGYNHQVLVYVFHINFYNGSINGRSITCKKANQGYVKKVQLRYTLPTSQFHNTVN